MPSEVEFHREGTYVMVRYSGVVTNEDVLAVPRTVYPNPEVTRRRLVGFSDHTAAERFDVDGSLISPLAGLYVEASRYAPEGTAIAALVKGEEDYGLFRMFLAYLEDAGWNVRIFWDRQEAEAWLDERWAELWEQNPE